MNKDLRKLLIEIGKLSCELIVLVGLITALVVIIVRCF